MKKIDPILHEKLTMLIESMGYELVGCEMVSQGRHTVFRIYIDSQTGVTVDDCSKVSFQVSAMMDVLEPVRGAYSLEISSPGINRPLFELEQYQRFVGKQLNVKLQLPVQNRRQYKGILQAVKGEDIYLLVDGLMQEVVLPFSMIEKANLIGEVSIGGQKTKKGNKKRRKEDV